MATPSTLNMTAQVQNALNGSQSTGSTPVDANAVIEQMVRGMVMRTDRKGPPRSACSSSPKTSET